MFKQKKVFGKPLKDVLVGEESWPSGIPKIVLSLTEWLNQHLDQPGPFRVAASQKQLAALVDILEAGGDATDILQDLSVERGTALACSTLREYLVRLPGGLLKSTLYRDWISAGEDVALPVLRELAAQLPQGNAHEP